MLEPDARGGKNWVLGVTALASFMMALDGQVITTAFATIRGEFGASVETLQWTVNGYNLTFAVLLLTVLRWATASAVGRCSPPAFFCLPLHQWHVRCQAAWRR